jgi:hypothetical protein
MKSNLTPTNTAPTDTTYPNSHLKILSSMESPSPQPPKVGQRRSLRTNLAIAAAISSLLATIAALAIAAL